MPSPPSATSRSLRSSASPIAPAASRAPAAIASAASIALRLPLNLSGATTTGSGDGGGAVIPLLPRCGSRRGRHHVSDVAFAAQYERPVCGSSNRFVRFVECRGQVHRDLAAEPAPAYQREVVP